MPQVRIRKTVITGGPWGGDGHTGYNFMGPDEEICSNISLATNGAYQGYEEELVGELDDAYELVECGSGLWEAFEITGKMEYCMSVSYCLYEGVLKIHDN